MDTKNMRYGQFLKAKRISDSRELTLKDVAAELGVSFSYVSDIEQGRRKPYDEAKHIYYLSVVFDDGKLYPGGQEHFRQEIQVRLRNPEGSWDTSNDPSFEGLSLGNTALTEKIALFEDGELIFGQEP